MDDHSDGPSSNIRPLGVSIRLVIASLVTAFTMLGHAFFLDQSPRSAHLALLVLAEAPFVGALAAWFVLTDAGYFRLWLIPTAALLGFAAGAITLDYLYQPLSHPLWGTEATLWLMVCTWLSSTTGTIWRRPTRKTPIGLIVTGLMIFLPTFVLYVVAWTV